MNKWRSWWIAPLSVGMLLTAWSGWMLYLGSVRDWNWFWMFMLWFPLLVGVLLTTVGAASRTAKWLHVRVNTGQDEWPRRIAISFPIPIRLTGWILHTFGHFIPEVNGLNVGVMFEELTSALTPEEPIYIEVDEGPGAEKVQVFIG